MPNIIRNLTLGLVVTITGCTTTTYLPNDQAMLDLNQVAKAAQVSNANLVQLQAQKPTVIYHTKVIRKHASQTRYQGELQPALQQLAAKLGARLLVQGKPVDTRITFVWDHDALRVLSAIQAQLPPNIKVVNYPKTQTLLVIYG